MRTAGLERKRCVVPKSILAKLRTAGIVPGSFCQQLAGAVVYKNKVWGW